MKPEALREIIAHVRDAVLVTEAEPIDGPDGPRIVFVNEAFERMTGWTSAEVVGQTPRILQSPDTDRTELDRLRTALERWQPVDVTLLNRRKDGTPFWVELSITPVADEHGWFTRWVSIQREVTARHEAARETLRRERFHHAVLDSQPSHTCVIDARGRILSVNARWTAFSAANGGCDQRTGVGESYLDVCRRALGDRSEQAREVHDGLVELLAGRRTRVEVVYPCDGPGEERWFRMTAVPLLSADGGAVISHTNVTQEVLSERRATRLGVEQGALRAVATAVAHRAPLGHVAQVAADRVRAVLGAKAVQVLEADPSGSSVLARAGADAPELTPALRACVDGDEPVARDRLHAVPVLADGERWGAIGAAWDGPADADAPRLLEAFAELLTASVQHHQYRCALERRAATDPLTGLGNHRSIQERLREEVARARRHGRPLALALVDVDRFKAVNDHLGHQRGDQVLATVARILREACRSEDVLGRIGGDEFAVLLPDTDAVGAYAILERARCRIAERPIVGEVAVTISAGVCDLARTSDPESLFAFADGALYWAKAHGRDVTWIYDPDVVRELSAQERAEQLERSQGLLGLRALARAIDAKDPSTRQHSERVAEIAVGLAQELGWAPEDVRALREAALVHDVGKIGIPDAVLLKPGRLTDEEYELVKTHAAIGAGIVDDVLGPVQVAWVRAHHERVDGRGYPDGLAGDAIPQGARILAVADSFDVMTSYRQYSAAMPLEDALAECRRCAGTQLDPEVVAALERYASTDGDVGAAWTPSRSGVPPTSASAGLRSKPAAR